MSKYSNLWGTLRTTLCDHHNVSSWDFDDNNPALSSFRRKSYFLFLLEVVLFEYRKNEIGIWFQQSPEETLRSFVYSKTGILPDQFDTLSNKAKLTILLKPLSEALLPETAQSYLKNLAEPTAFGNLEIDPFEGWTLGTGWPLLKQE